MSETEELEKIGLSRQEATVYLNTLKMGVAKASEIAQKSHLQRGGVYYTLKLLKERGFISEVIKSGVKHYSAAPSNRILDLVKEEYEQRAQVIQSIMPNLESLQRTALSRPEVEVFEGSEGFKTIFAKLLESKDKEFLCYLSSSILQYLPQFHVQFRRRRREQKIRIRTITEKTEQLQQIQKMDVFELRETRFMDALFVGTNTLCYILSDALIFIKANKQEQIAVFVKEASLAKLHANVFEVLWRMAERECCVRISV